MTKRRRHVEAASTVVSLPSDAGAGPSSAPCLSRRGIHILDLPMEVLVKVVSLCGQRQLSESVRLVCRRFRHAAGLALEAEVSALERRIKAAMAAADAAVNASPTHYNLETNMRVFGALEIVQAQYRLLRAVTWRYRGWFFAGRLLQDVDCLLRNAAEVPRAVAFRFQPQSAPSAVPDRVAFESRVERFMTHFERHTERPINSGPAVSGAKLVDLLDCLESGPEYYNYEKDGGRYRLRALYRLPRCWFCCLRVGSPPPPVVSPAAAHAQQALEEWAAWRDAARFLFLRVRRLVAACNRHQLQARHVEREQLLQMPRIALPPPRPDAYSGVGVHPPYFFFYGSMNHSAYAARFDDSGGGAGGGSGGRGVGGGASDGSEAGGINAEMAPAGPSAAPPPPPPPPPLSPPPADLLVSVELDCALWQAPLSARRGHGAFSLPRAGDPEPFVLALEFRCPRSGADRLPSVCRFLVTDHGADEPAFEVALQD